MEVPAERSRGRRGGGGGRGRGWGRGGRGPGDRQQRAHEAERGDRGPGDRQQRAHEAERGDRGPGDRQQRAHDAERRGGGGRGWRGAQGRGSWGARPPRGRDRPVQQQEQQQVEDDVDKKEDYDQPNEFSRRQIVSNWDRYKTEEKELSDGGETLRGADFNVLLSSAGDSFAQFRFADEKEWEVEVSSSKQISPLFVDCQFLAQSLQELPLYLRLNVEAELVQITPPAELPQMRLKSMHDGLSKFSQFRAQATAPTTAVGTIPVNSVPEDSGKDTFNLMLNTAPESALPASHQPADKLDEELDFLLQLETPVSKSNIFLKGTRDVEVLCDPVAVNTSTDSSGAEVMDNTNSQPAETAKKLDPEEELEDWLDSMIT